MNAAPAPTPAVATSAARSSARTNAVWWALLRYAPLPLAATLVLMFGRMMIQFAPALVIRSMFDALEESGRLTPLLWMLAALLVGTAVARFVILTSATWAQATMSFLYATLLRVNGLEHLLRRPGAQLLPLPTGDIISRLGSDAWETAAYLNFLLLEATGVVVALWAVWIMARIDPWIALVALLPLVAVALITGLATSRLEKLRRARRSTDSVVSTFLGEIFGAVQAVQVAAAEQRVAAHFRRLNETRRSAVLHEQLFQGVIMNSLLNNSAHLATGVVLLMAAGKMRGGSFSVGDFALFTYFLPVLSDFIMGIGMALAHYRQTGVAVTRLEEVLEDEPQELVRHRPLGLLRPIPDKAQTQDDFPVRVGPARVGDTPGAALLAVRDLTYHYPISRPTGRHSLHGRDQLGRDQPGVENVTFTLVRGSLTVIAGRVGSGKTTLLRALLGLLPAQRGEIMWNGAFVPDSAAHFTPPRCAYVPQTPRLFSVSLRENILLDRAPREIEAALHAAVLEQDIGALEDGLETVVGPRGVRLSGGQAQRAATARAFAAGGESGLELLVLDDLSSALDVHTEQTLWERIAGQRNLTILAVSNRRVALQRADQIILMREGMIEATGSLRHLLETSEEMRLLYERAPDAENRNRMAQAAV